MKKILSLVAVISFAVTAPHINAAAPIAPVVAAPLAEQAAKEIIIRRAKELVTAQEAAVTRAQAKQTAATTAAEKTIAAAELEQANRDLTAAKADLETAEGLNFFQKKWCWAKKNPFKTGLMATVFVVTTASLIDLAIRGKKSLPCRAWKRMFNSNKYYQLDKMIAAKKAAEAAAQAAAQEFIK